MTQVPVTRVLLLTTSFPRHAADPAGSFVAGQAAALSAQNLRVRVLAPHAEWAPPGIEVVSYGGRAPDHGWPEALESSPGRTMFQAVDATRRLMRAACRVALPEEVLVAHWLAPCGLAALRVSACNGVVAWSHGGDLALLERLPVGRTLARHLDAGAATLAFVSDDLRHRFQRLLGRPRRTDLVVAPMGVSPPEPDPATMRRLRTLAGGRPIVATVGRQVPIKGLDVLERALRGLDVAWLAAGEGPSVPPVAHALGVLDPRARDALLAVADVFVQPSRVLNGRTEGAPVAVLEALASGVPVVATRTGGLSEVASGARLVPPEDPTALAAAISAAVRDGRGQRDERFLWETLGVEHARLVVRSARRRRP